jgi:hypothetical protein
MPPDLTDDETQALIDYARRKFEEKRWPLSPALRPIREVLDKIDPKPEPEPKPYVPSLLARRKNRRR